MSQTLKLYIPKVLSENKVVLLKGIGTLRINYRSALINHDLSVITPPKEEIYFVPADEPKIDPVLVKIVELITQVDHEEATDLVYTFMKDLQSELRVNGFLSFPSIGWIKQDRWGSLFFEPASEYISINRFFGLNQVKLPESLSKAEQEVLADLRETVHEGASSRSYSIAQPRRRWGFIISSLLVLLTAVGFLWYQSRPNLSESQMVTSDGKTGDSLTKDPLLKQNSDSGQAIPSSTFKEVGPNFIPVFRDLEAIISFTEEDAKQCIIIVGAFAEPGNVDRMINRIEGTSYQSVIIPGSRLTKVGLKINCEDDPDSTLDWARRELNESAWLYTKPL